VTENRVRLACAFAPGLQTPDHIAEAERLGYRRAWVYDSPAILADVWMTLARAADRTSTIEIGPGVLVPSLRHPMTNAAAIATLEALAPGRVVVAIGSGFTGRHCLGQRPLKWTFVEEYVSALRGLLRGEMVEWEGAPIRMMQSGDFGAARPIDVPILVGADGPKGTAVAARVGDGVFAAGLPNAAVASSGRPQSLLQFGTVLDEGEDLHSQRVLDAAGHAVAVVFHATYERQGADAVRGFPGGGTWVDAIEPIPERERHLATHEGHLMRLTAVDEQAVAEGIDILPAVTFSGTADQLQERVLDFAAAGVTEIAYQPAGPDIPGELARMADALRPVTT
jgi:5,10-methylenetetrahydromethanopterin reductase